MSHIVVRFGASLLTFILGIALVSVTKPQQAPYTPCRSRTTRPDRNDAANNARAIDDNLSEDEKHEKFGYGVDGIKCRVSFADSTWVPRKNVILKIELENTTDKDIIIPAEFELELNQKGLDRQDIVSGQAFRSRGWLDIQNGKPIPMYSNFASPRYYVTRAGKSFRLRAGEKLQIEGGMSRMSWSDLLSSDFSNDNHFADIVPPGEYEFFIRFRGAKWIIGSNQAEVRIE